MTRWDKASAPGEKILPCMCALLFWYSSTRATHFHAFTVVVGMPPFHGKGSLVSYPGWYQPCDVQYFADRLCITTLGG